MQNRSQNPLPRFAYVILLLLCLAAGESAWDYFAPESFSLTRIIDDLEPFSPELADQLRSIGEEPVAPPPLATSQVLGPTNTPFPTETARPSQDLLWSLTGSLPDPSKLTVMNDILYVQDGTGGVTTIDKFGQVLDKISINRPFYQFSVLPNDQMVVTAQEGQSIQVRLSSISSVSNGIIFNIPLFDVMNPIDLTTTASRIIVLDDDAIGPVLYRYNYGGERYGLTEISHSIDHNTKIAANQDGLVYIPLKERITLVRIDTEGNETFLRLGNAPIAVDSDGDQLLAVLSGGFDRLSAQLIIDDQTNEGELLENYYLGGIGEGRDIAIWDDMIVVSTSRGLFAYGLTRPDPSELALLTPDPEPSPTASPAAKPTATVSTPLTNPNYFVEDLQPVTYPLVDTILTLPQSFESSLFGVMPGETPFVVSEWDGEGIASVVVQLSPIESLGESDLIDAYDLFKDEREQGGNIQVGSYEPFEPLLTYINPTGISAPLSGTLDGEEIEGRVIFIESIDGMMGIIHVYFDKEIWDPAGQALFDIILETAVVVEIP